MQAEPVRPLPVGTKLTYYNHERMQELEATVKSAGLYMIWVVDVKESDAKEHFIGYDDIVSVLPDVSKNDMKQPFSLEEREEAG